MSDLTKEVNTLRPRQNRRHFADDVFKWIFLNENMWIPINISLKFVPRCPINNIPTLVQIMAWRRPGDKPLSEPMMVRLPMHICVTRPQWVSSQLVFRSHSNNWYISLNPYVQGPKSIWFNIVKIKVADALAPCVARHQRPWYWLCRIGKFLCYLRKDFKYLRHVNVEEWHKM